MSDWSKVSLGEVATIERDIVKPTDISNGTLYVGLENIESGGRFVAVRAVANGELASSKFAFTSSHVLYGKLRPYLGKIACPDFAGVCSTDILPVLPGPRIDRSFLTLFLRQPGMVELANSRATGANLPRLSPRALEEFEISLPAMAEQRRIASILDQANALRANRRAALAQLDTLTQSIFLDLFGDDIAKASGWPTLALAQLVREGDKINYGVVQPGDDLDEGAPLIRIGDLVEGHVSHAALKRIAPSIEAKYKRSRLRGDEVLVSCVGSIGIVALADQSVRGSNIARAVARIPLAENVSRIFVAAYLRTDIVQRYFKNELRTVSQPTLNIKQLSQTQIRLPSRELQAEFDCRTSAVERLRASLRTSQRHLDALFASLQHRAFRGEI